MAEEASGRPPQETLSLWKREQARLKARVVARDTEAWQRDPAFAGLRRVGGVDVSFVKGDGARACASLVVLSFPELEVVYEDCRMVSLTAPYVSGFLAFREVPFLVDAVQQLREKEPHLMPQVLLVDGNGVLHHRGFGVACHLGILTDLPCIGVAKKLLQVDGLENNALHKERIRHLRAGGDTFTLTGGSGAVLGMALRSHDHSTKPLYVSVGHKMSLEAAVRLTHCCCRFRVPEPVRQADIRSRDYIRRTLGAPAPALDRSQKPQRPKVSPKGSSGEPAGEGRPPQPPVEAPGCTREPQTPAPSSRRVRATDLEQSRPPEDPRPPPPPLDSDPPSGGAGPPQVVGPKPWGSGCHTLLQGSGHRTALGHAGAAPGSQQQAEGLAPGRLCACPAPLAHTPSSPCG